MAQLLLARDLFMLFMDRIIVERHRYKPICSRAVVLVLEVPII
jgi:hypothetical protein